MTDGLVPTGVVYRERGVWVVEVVNPETAALLCAGGIRVSTWEEVRREIDARADQGEAMKEPFWSRVARVFWSIVEDLIDYGGVEAKEIRQDRADRWAERL